MIAVCLMPSESGSRFLMPSADCCITEDVAKFKSRVQSYFAVLFDNLPMMPLSEFGERVRLQKDKYDQHRSDIRVDQQPHQSANA